jgi:hypothetical protein
MAVCDGRKAIRPSCCTGDGSFDTGLFPRNGYRCPCIDQTIKHDRNQCKRADVLICTYGYPQGNENSCCGSVANSRMKASCEYDLRNVEGRKQSK